MFQTYSLRQITPLPLFETQNSNIQDKENEPYSIPYETIGGILSDTKYVWSSRGPNFTIVDSRSGNKIASWTFGSITRDYSTKVVCVSELLRPSGKFPLLIVGLDRDGINGTVCVFDITASKILRAIEIKEKITSLHMINTEQENCPIPGPLRAFDGILMVGTAGGNILILDICRQIYEEESIGCIHSNLRDESNCCQIKIMYLDEVNSLELYKQSAERNGEHLCLLLNAAIDPVPHFVLKGPEGEDRIYANKMEVTISTVHYCPQLGSLMVGYNFGAWQIWNLMNLKLEYTSPVYEENIPVTHFAVQEPCDDPRSFCYIWVVYSNIESYHQGLPLAVLYALNYGSREWHEGYGVLYQDLLSCAVRFQMDLSIFEKGESDAQHGAYCLRVQAINKSVTKGIAMQENHEEALALCAFVWNEWKAKSNLNTNTKVYMTLFDLNQWYKDQMPNSCNLSDQRNFLTSICLTDLLNNVSLEKFQFLDVFINSKTITPFIGSQRLEEHYHPSSLGFELCSLRVGDILFFNNQGTQKAFLFQLESGGPLTLIDPTRMFQQCIHLGLYPLFVDHPVSSETSQDYQREILLSTALEQQLLSWLCRCVSAWCNGSYSISGLTLPFILNWAWQRALVLKNQANKLVVPLFDYSCTRLDSNSYNLLSNCVRQLSNLATLYGFIIKKFSSNLIEENQVKEQWHSLKMVSTHLEVLQWLLNVGLLPEYPLSSYPRENEFNRISVPYPIDDLIKYYSRRRKLLKDFNMHKFYDNKSLLFIDNLIEMECRGDKLKEQWKCDGGDGMYPPISLQALLRTYLVEEVSLSFKHCVIVYLFLDLAMTLDKSRYNLITTHLIKFPAVFQLSPSIIRITQAFWQLDHGDFTIAMEHLLDPLVAMEDLKIWHHRIVLKSLLLQEQHKLALLYLQVIKPPINHVDDLSTVLSLLVTNDMLDEAFYFQKYNRSAVTTEKLLRHFYKEVDELGKISSIIYLPLDVDEEKSFMTYIQDVKHPQQQDLQLFYYIQHSRIMDAYDANEKFNIVKGENRGLYGMSHISQPESMINGLMNNLPKVSKDLIKTCYQEKNKLWFEVSKPEPFSVSIHDTDNEASYKTNFINSLISKVKETWSHPVVDSNMPNEHMQSTNISKKLSFENIPFLNTPKRITSYTRFTIPTIYPKIVEKSKIDTEEYGPSPAKKRKKDSLMNSSLQQNKSHLDELYCQSFKLETPIIKRKLSKSLSPTRSCLLFSTKTPQSILKINNSTKVQEENIDKKLVENIFPVTQTPINHSNLSSIRSRRSIGHTPRPAVRFNMKSDSSDSSEDNNVPDVSIIEQQEVTHSSLQYVRIQESEICSANSSLSTATFYSPNLSLNESDANTHAIDELKMESLGKEEYHYKNANQFSRKRIHQESEDVATSTELKLPKLVKGRRSYKKLDSSKNLQSDDISSTAVLARSNSKLAGTVKDDILIQRDDNRPDLLSNFSLLTENKNSNISDDFNISSEELKNNSNSTNSINFSAIRGRKSIERRASEPKKYAQLSEKKSNGKFMILSDYLVRAGNKNNEKEQSTHVVEDSSVTPEQISDSMTSSVISKVNLKTCRETMQEFPKHSDNKIDSKYSSAEEFFTNTKNNQLETNIQIKQHATGNIEESVSLCLNDLITGNISTNVSVSENNIFLKETKKVLVDQKEEPLNKKDVASMDVEITELTDISEDDQSADESLNMQVIFEDDSENSKSVQENIDEIVIISESEEGLSCIKKNIKDFEVLPEENEIEIETQDHTNNVPRSRKLSTRSVDREMIPKIRTRKSYSCTDETSTPVINIISKEHTGSLDTLDVSETNRKATTKRTQRKGCHTIVTAENDLEAEQPKNYNKSGPSDDNNFKNEIEKYSSNRRVTRHQIQLLEKNIVAMSPKVSIDAARNDNHLPTSDITVRNLRSRSVASNTSLTSEASFETFSDQMITKKKRQTVRKSILPPRSTRGQSVDVLLPEETSIHTPRKLRARRASKDSQTCSEIIETKPAQIKKRRSLSFTLEETPTRRSERRINLKKSDLTRINEEQNAKTNDIVQTAGKRNLRKSSTSK